MKTKMFSVFDSKAGFYATPFSMVSTPAALRAFSDLVNDPQTTINKHPSDFILFEIGSFNDQSGELTMLVPPANLGIAVEYLRENKVVIPEVVK